MQVQIIIKSAKTYEPIVTDGIQWETARQGEPGKLTFTVIKDPYISFEEGNEVNLFIDGKLIFVGFVFSKTRNKDHHIKVTAYDQLRYLKNKFVYMYTNTATGLIKSIATDFGLRVGTLANTGYTIVARVEENVTLFDAIKNALDLTFDNTGEIYVLYDDAGKITLKNIFDMQLKTVIDEETAEDFDYTSSIDSQTYNSILLYYEEGQEKDKQLRLVSPFRDDKTIQQWGLLQLVKKIDNVTSADAMGKKLLQAYNHKTRNLRIKGALGDINVRAGCMIPVILNLGDIVNKSYLLCERVTHTFEQGHHSMDLTMSGGEFIGS